MKPTTDEPTAILAGRVVTESQVRALCAAIGIDYPPPAVAADHRAAIEATQGAALAIPASGLLDTGRGAGLTPAPCAGGSFDLRFVPAELRDETRDYLIRHDLEWTEPCEVCGADMVRVDCPDCGGTGVDGEFGGAAGCLIGTPCADCDRCAGTGWMMRCAGCGAWDDDPGVIAAERRSLGLTAETPHDVAGFGRLYAALADHTAYPVGAGGPTVLLNQAHAEGAAPASADRQIAGVDERPGGSVAPSGQPCGDCRAALQAEEDARRALDEESLRVALMAEQDAEADAAFWGRVWDVVGVVVGTLALVFAAVTLIWLWGGLGR
jgi:hypothetical protein